MKEKVILSITDDKDYEGYVEISLHKNNNTEHICSYPAHKMDTFIIECLEDYLMKYGVTKLEVECNLDLCLLAQTMLKNAHEYLEDEE